MTIDDIKQAMDAEGRPAFWYAEGHVERSQFAAAILAFGGRINEHRTFGDGAEVLGGLHGWLRIHQGRGVLSAYDLRADPAEGYRPVTAISA